MASGGVLSGNAPTMRSGSVSESGGTTSPGGPPVRATGDTAPGGFGSSDSMVTTLASGDTLTSGGVAAAGSNSDGAGDLNSRGTALDGVVTTGEVTSIVVNYGRVEALQPVVDPATGGAIFVCGSSVTGGALLMVGH